MNLQESADRVRPRPAGVSQVSSQTGAGCSIVVTVRLSEIDYELPAELIAQRPVEKRDHSRLMVVRRTTGEIEHARFCDLPTLTEPGDLFVLNNSRVLPARLFATKKGGEARIELLLLNEVAEGLWEALVRPGRRARPGTRLILEPGGVEAEVLESDLPEKRRIRFESEGNLRDWIERFGMTPLPPYIKRPGVGETPLDRERYQTVYAKESNSVAAPTAGLHFTRELLETLATCEITLHVGYGTFKPVQADEIERHTMDREYYSIPPAAAGQIAKASAAGKRTIAVGTTTTRTLEHVARLHGEVVADRGWTDLFIYPPYEFRAAKGLITNFHLPKTTLLLLVSAFAGRELIRMAYESAIRERYRFYSYGDAMLIL